MEGLLSTGPTSSSFSRKANFLQVLDYVLRLIKKYLSVQCHTVIICNSIFSEIFQVSGNKTQILEVIKLRFVLTNGPLLFTSWLGQCTIALLQKDQKMTKLIPSKKSVKVSFVTSGMEKIIKKKADNFLFLP